MENLSPVGAKVEDYLEKVGFSITHIHIIVVFC